MPARSPAAPRQSGLRLCRRRADRDPNRRRNALTDPLESRLLLSLAPIGDVFRVNADATGSHTAPDVAMAADGTFVVAWQRSAGPGANTAQAFARGFDRLGAAKFSDILVSPPGEPDVHVRVAIDDAGEFSTAWGGSTGASGNSIYTSRYHADGSLSAWASAEEGMQGALIGNPHDFDIVMDEDGGFSDVVWKEEPGVNVDIAPQTLSDRTFLNGQPVTSPGIVDETSAGTGHMAASMAADGTFAVAWEAADPSTHRNTIFANRFDALGDPQGLHFIAAAPSANGSVATPDVAMAADGTFVVSWIEHGGSDTQAVVRARRYAPAGEALGPAFDVYFPNQNVSYGTGPTVAMADNGSFLVAWQAVSGQGTASASSHIFARQYNAAGQASGAAFEVGTANAAGDSFEVSAAVDDSGANGVVVWATKAEGGGDGEVVARRLALNPDPTPPPAPNQAPATDGIPPVTVSADAGSTSVDLFAAFNDDKDADAALDLTVVSNNNASLFASVGIDAPTGRLELQLAPGTSGTATLVVRATDTAGASTDASFDVTVLPATPLPPPLPPPPAGTGTLVGTLVQKVMVNGRRRKAPAAGVEVFLDANANGTRDADEPAVTTAADGSYAFTTLAAGVYRVRVSSPGWQVAARRNAKARGVMIRARQRKAARAKPMTLISTSA